MTELDRFFDQFLRERVYLHNITPKTKIFYETAWAAYRRYQDSQPPRPHHPPLIAKTDLQGFVIHLRDRGVKPVSCNCWMRGLNAFCKWLHAQGEIVLRDGGDAERDRFAYAASTEGAVANTGH